MSWKFKKYEEDDVQRDSSSDKFFKESTGSDSLIREFIQNSLDARISKKPVKIIIQKKKIGQKFFTPFLFSLKPHLKDVGIVVPDGNISTLVLEDFNTKGLEGKNKKDFFYRDNITRKTEGGGSHGIGKAVFYSSSKIKSFFGYSVFEKHKNICLGRSVLKSHGGRDSDKYRPDGILDIDIEKHEEFIEKLFKREKNEKGLSVAIPYCDIEIEDIKQSCLSQFYVPIICKELVIEIEKQSINDDTLLNLIYKSTENLSKEKVALVMDYQTTSRETIKKCNVKVKEWKNQKIPKVNISDLKNENQPLFISFKIEMPVINENTEYGLAVLLIKKEEDTKEQSIDCWRDNLLIPSALGYSRKEREYTTIFLISDNPLSKLLRELEDPGHTRWQIGTLSREIKEKYKNVGDLIRFIRKLPLEIIRQIKHRPIEQDSSFFSDYFPDISSATEKKKNAEGQSSQKNSQGGSEEIPPMEPSFPNFKYKPHKKGDGFKLTLKPNKNYSKVIKVRTAYGTNIGGDAFKHYDKRDFEFNKNIQIIVNNGNKISCHENIAEYSIENEKFSLAFSGFDPDKELRIEVK